MKISAISNHQTFKGLFIDKTKDENWLMEYHPYSWENYHNTECHAPYYDVRTTIMDKKQQVDILASKLPNNEEIFTPLTEKAPAISKDILGTISYYEYPVNINLGEFRNKITQSSPLNLEESLKVYLQKHEKFREMKREEMQKSKQEIKDSLKQLSESIEECRSASRKSEGINLFSDAPEKRSEAFYNLDMVVRRNHENLVNRYIKLAESMEELDTFISKMRNDLKLISQRKRTGDVIDISIRHPYDPNKALYEEGLRLANNPQEIQKTQKLVLLSHRAVPLREIIQTWKQQYANGAKENLQKFLKHLPEDLTHIADKMISFRL